MTRVLLSASKIGSSRNNTASFCANTVAASAVARMLLRIGVSKVAVMRPSPAASSASAVGEVATSCGICVRNDQLVASAGRLPAKSWIAAETSIVYSEPGRRPPSGKRRTELVSSSYVGTESCASGVVPRRISKLSPRMVAGSMASEKVILTSPTATDIPLAAMAGVAPVTVGRVVSRERTSTISKTAMALPLASTAPITCKVAVPEGISAPTVNWPLHDVPVNCNSSKSKVSAPITT